MKIQSRTLIVAGIVGLAAVLYAAQSATLLSVNGKKTPNGVIYEGESAYVSLAALKAAGAEVSVTGERVAIQFTPLKDQIQSDAAEGVLGEWIQNGGWRVKVHSIAPSKSPFGKGGGFAIKFEFRNLVGKTMNFGASGLKGMQIFDENGLGMLYSVSSFKDLYKPVAPGGGFTSDLVFGLGAGDTRPVGKPAKLLIKFGQSGKNRFKDIRIDLSGN